MKGDLCRHSICMVFILISTFNTVSCIRVLKEGPMIGPDSREYKGSLLGKDRIATDRAPSSPSAVRVICTEATMSVIIQADLYKNGRYVFPDEFYLGQGKSEQKVCQAVPVSDTKYVIEAGLNDCDSKLVVIDDFMVYWNTLVYSPVATNDGIARKIQAFIPVACYHKRMQARSLAPLPLSTYPEVSTQKSGFSLTLMTDDWKRQRTSKVFSLGDILHIEAAYWSTGHPHRRLFINSCVATLDPHETSVPRYYFIKNHGCFTDAKYPGSNAQFLSRKRSNILQLLLDVFMFHHDQRNSIYITCHLKVVHEKQRVSSTNKACNYANRRWKSVDGSEVCGCCETTCAASHLTKTNLMRLPVAEGSAGCSSVTLGPVIINPPK